MKPARLFLLLLLVLFASAVLPAGSAFAATDGANPVGAPVVSAAQSSCVYYVVQYGDTLSSIARRYGTTVWNLAYLNHLPSIHNIYPGQVLLIYPCASLPPQPAPVVQPPPPPVVVVTVPPPPPPYPNCAITPKLGFGQVWFTYADIRAALGCPTSQEAGLVITFQYYQNGWLWYVHGDGHWELLNPRTRVWGIYPDESSARAAAAAQLGAPITGPFIVHGTYQFYEGGSMVWTPVTDVVVFAHSGTWWDY